MKIAIVALILLAGLMQTAVLADGNTGFVRGTVVRADSGRPVSNAVVYWVNPSGKGYTRTNAAGRFYLFNVIPGLTTVWSTATSFTGGCLRGHVGANETIDAVIPLVQRGLFACVPLHAIGREAVEDSH